MVNSLLPENLHKISSEIMYFISGQWTILPYTCASCASGISHLELVLVYSSYSEILNMLKVSLCFCFFIWSSEHLPALEVKCHIVINFLVHDIIQWFTVQKCAWKLPCRWGNEVVEKYTREIYLQHFFVTWLFQIAGKWPALWENMMRVNGGIPAHATNSDVLLSKEWKL